MENIKFKSLEELYNRLSYALDTKIEEMKLNGIGYIDKDDLWNYLKDNKWNKKTGLTLSECVDDILNTDELEYKKFVKDKMKNILGGEH